MNFLFQALTALVISIISPTVLILLVSKIFKLGELNEKFKGGLEDIKMLKDKLGKNTQSINNLASDMTVIKTVLVKDWGLDVNLFSSASPLKLMPKGKKLLKESNFDRILKDNNEFFIEKLAEFPISSEAEIDKASTQLLESLKEDPLLEGFKDIAYKHGLVVEVLLKVCAIYLRDYAIGHFLKKLKPLKLSKH